MLDFKYSPRGPISINQKVDLKRLGYLLKVYPNAINKPGICRKLRKKCNNEGEIKVVYNYKPDAGGYGRMFNFDTGLHALSSDTRSFICDGQFRDIDQVCGNPTIYMNLCDMYKVPIKYIRKYVEKRETILDKYTDKFDVPRCDVKNAFNMCFYGAGNKSIAKQLQASMKDVSFLVKLKQEVKYTCGLLFANKKFYPLIKKIRELKGEKCHDGTILSYIVSSYENEILFCMKKFFESKDMHVNALIFDGFLVESDKELVEELRECEAYIKENTGFVMKLKDKPMKSKYVFDEDMINQSNEFEAPGYLVAKQDFESYACKVTISPACFVIFDKTKKVIIEHPKSKIKEMYEELTYIKKTRGDYGMEIEHVPFLSTWFRDPNKRSYERIDFCPQGAGPEVLNLFDGFAVDHIPHKQNKEGRDFCLEHINSLAGYDDKSYKWLLKYLKHLFCKPWEKPDIGVLIGGLQGTGKNMAINLFTKMMGSKYITVVPDSEELFDDHAENAINKLVICIEETSLKSSYKYLQKEKAIITCDKHNINPKNVRPYTVASHCRLFKFDNNNAHVIEQSDRRWVMFEASSKNISNTNYFVKLAAYIDDPAVQYSLYKYFLNMDDVTKAELKIERPITDAYEELKQTIVPVPFRFLQTKIDAIEGLYATYDKDEDTIEDLRQRVDAISDWNIADLYDEFRKYKDKYYPGSRVESLNMFSRVLSRLQFAKVRNANDRRVYLDIPIFKASMKNLGISMN